MAIVNSSVNPFKAVCQRYGVTGVLNVLAYNYLFFITGRNEVVAKVISVNWVEWI